MAGGAARPPFIVFEGADGVGKSTQVHRLVETMKAAGFAALATREPGGAPAAEMIRNMLVRGQTDALSPIAETLMMYAARAEHLRTTINPARARGEIVVCDRFSDSTRAYQGHAGAVAGEFIDVIDAAVVGVDGPTLTIVLDVDDQVAAGRIASRSAGSGETRFERKGEAYRASVREAFRRIAAASPADHVMVDASADADSVAEIVARHVLPLVQRWRSASG